MSDRMVEEIDDVLPLEPNGELVHWMEPRPMSLGVTGVSMATAAAFALGVAATVAVMAVMRWGFPRRESELLLGADFRSSLRRRGPKPGLSRRSRMARAGPGFPPPPE